MTRISRTTAWRMVAGAFTAFGAIAAVAAPSHAQAPAKAVVAVLEFDNAAMVKRDEFAAMTVGVQVMLANALATNGQVQVVERQKIQEILAEQNLGTAGRLDPATAAKVGKILGAQYVLLGAIVVDGRQVASLDVGQKGAIIASQTPFYGESGGQTGDHGLIRSAEGAVFRVTDTQKRVGDVFIHIGEVERGSFKPGEAVALHVDHTRRSGNRIHHSATHLLHEALRLTLGSHVAQKGSLVEPNRLRFDVSHNKSMSHDELSQVEAIANGMVLQNDQVTTRLMSVDAAIAEGAMALFGEKYGDEVRAVSMGRNTHGAGRPIYSLELCGGTHVYRTGDIGLIKVISESAVAAGVRRVEALAGPAARAYLEEQDRRVQAVAAVLKTAPADVVSRIEVLMDERRKLEKELAEARKQLAMRGGGTSGEEGISEVNGIKFMARILKGISPNDMKGLVDEGKARLGSGVVALIGINDEGRAGLIVGVTPDLTARFNAVDLVRTGSAVLGGKGGGGRPDMAQAGGPDGGKAEDALAAIRAALT